MSMGLSKIFKYREYGFKESPRVVSKFLDVPWTFLDISWIFVIRTSHYVITDNRELEHSCSTINFITIALYNSIQNLLVCNPIICTNCSL